MVLCLINIAYEGVQGNAGPAAVNVILEATAVLLLLTVDNSHVGWLTVAVV